MKKINHKILKIKIKEFLIKNGANNFQLNLYPKDWLASLRGVDSHGIRLLPHYINALKNGRINGNPKFKVIKTFPAFVDQC